MSSRSSVVVEINGHRVRRISTGDCSQVGWYLITSLVEEFVWPRGCLVVCAGKHSIREEVRVDVLVLGPSASEKSGWFVNKLFRGGTSQQEQWFESSRVDGGEEFVYI